MAERTKVVLVSLDPDLVDLIEAMPTLELIGFLDHSAAARDPVIPHLGPDSAWPALLAAMSGLRAIVAVDPPRLREKLAAHYGAGNLLTLIASDAFVSPRATVGAGTVVQRACHIGRNSVIGACCKLNVGATVHHDCTVGDYATLAPGSRLLGTVAVGRGCYVGSGAIVLPRRTLGDGVVVGAGAVVTHDIAPGSVVAGVPARPLTADAAARR
jgi:sugar O-acyltransferase (sialic acid O-acetyltransferase NeuD family)